MLRAVRGVAPRRDALGLAAVAIATAVALGGTATADVPATDLARARDAYERGRIANDRGDFARAARELALADSILPDPVTLRVALHAATLADDPVLGVELVARASRSPTDKALGEAVAQARARFAHRTGRIVVTCGSASHCIAVVDGAEAKPDVARVVGVGVHTVGAQGDGALEQRMVSVAADETATVRLGAGAAAYASVTPSSPPPIAAPNESDRRGPSPATAPSERPSPRWFIGAATATVAFGALGGLFAIDAANGHATFVKDGCQGAAEPACATDASRGKLAQGLMDASFALAGALAVSTAVLGVLVFRSTDGREAALQLGPGAAAVRASF